MSAKIVKGFTKDYIFYKEFHVVIIFSLWCPGFFD